MLLLPMVAALYRPLRRPNIVLPNIVRSSSPPDEDKLEGSDIAKILPLHHQSRTSLASQHVIGNIFDRVVMVIVTGARLKLGLELNG